MNSVFCTDHGLARLVQAYREHGHKAAKINPLLPEKPVTASVPEITVLSSIIKGHLDTSGELQPSSETNNTSSHDWNLWRFCS